MVKPNKEAIEKIEAWYGGNDHEILFTWEDTGTYFVSILCGYYVEFVRVFPIGDTYHLSVDGTKKVGRSKAGAS